MEQVTEQQVRESVATAKTHLAKAAEQVVWQVQNKAWLVLGYSSWTAMVDAEYDGTAVLVQRDLRKVVVADLRVEGLSQTEIAKTLGVSVGTVNGDLAKAAKDGVFNSENTSGTRVDSTGRVQPTTKPRVSANAPTPEAASAQLDDYLKRRKDEREEQFISAKGEQYVWGEVETLVGVARLRLTEARERAVRLTDPDNPRTDGIDRAKRAIAKLEIELSTLKSLVGDTDWDALLREEQ